MKTEALKQKMLPVMSMLQCPRCGTSMEFRQNSAVCQSGHCFDLSAKGYLNVAPEHDQSREKYDGVLFQNRRRILKERFYLPLREAIVSVIEKRYGTLPFTAVDIGCGEGTHTKQMQERFPNAVWIGTDISRDAIAAAASGGSKPIWLIADLKKLPFTDHSCDVLLDILTPADYTEFRRVIKPSGCFLKVIPGKDYLSEIRNAVSNRLSNGTQYSNNDVLEHLWKNCKVNEEISVYNRFSLSEDESKAFLHMTPMTFAMDAPYLDTVRISEITIDLQLMVCSL